MSLFRKGDLAPGHGGNNQEEEWIDTAEVRQRFDISRRTLQYWAEEGLIQVQKGGRGGRNFYLASEIKRVKEGRPKPEELNKKGPSAGKFKERLGFWIFAIMAVMIFTLYHNNQTYLMIAFALSLLLILYAGDMIKAMTATDTEKNWLWALVIIAPVPGYIIVSVLWKRLKKHRI